MDGKMMRSKKMKYEKHRKTIKKYCGGNSGICTGFLTIQINSMGMNGEAFGFDRGYNGIDMKLPFVVGAEISERVIEKREQQREFIMVFS